jgi:hypothetical protein
MFGNRVTCPEATEHGGTNSMWRHTSGVYGFDTLIARACV